MSDFNLGDVPDLSGVTEQEQSPFTEGWYEGTIQGQRSFTDRNGNDRLFESSDTPSVAGDSRNIRLQVEVKRASDGRIMNTSALVNYRPEDLSASTVAQVLAHKEKVAAGEEWGPMFRPFATLQRLGKLQKIAGVRQLGRNGNGGLDLHPIFGKKAYFKLATDDRNPQYMKIADFRETKPKSVL